MRRYDARERLMSIKSGHGVGKSTLLAWLMCHHLLFRYPQKTVVTAPSSTQLWDALWAEFRSCIEKLPAHWRDLLNPKADRVELTRKPDDSFVSARTSRAETPEALQGVHSQWVLLIADEASGIPEPVFEAAMGSMSGHNAITILTGNPVRTSGLFHATHTALADLWWTKTVSTLDVPAAVSGLFVEQVRRTYGEHSNAYRVRVLGEFPTSESDTIIPFELVEAAIKRDIRAQVGAAVVWGLDVARFGDDRTALAKRRGTELLEPIKIWTKLDTMQVAGRIHNEYTHTPLDIRPLEINVDVIGLGAGVLDRLRQLGLPARGINISEAPALMAQERYRDLRTELWFRAREWFERRDCKLPAFYERAPEGQDLVRELTVWKYDYAPQSNKIVALSKRDMKKKYGVDSPDLAEAFILTLASDAMRLVHGRRGNTSWRAPIHTGRKGIAIG